jgi:hypothetical protein
MGVRNAARQTFRRYGDEEYAAQKATAFLRKCGCKAGADLHHQTVSKDKVQQAARAMLDAGAEKFLWSMLK